MSSKFPIVALANTRNSPAIASVYRRVFGNAEFQPASPKLNQSFSKFFMFKIPDAFKILGVCMMSMQTINAYAYESSLKADVNANTEYNSNIFLTTQPHNATTGLIVTPSLSGIIKEQNWEAIVGARIKSHNYSDDNINSNDQYFNLTGRYSAERNIFSLNVNHDLASNLNSTSTDFGVVGRRINTKNQSISPQYTRLLTERLVLSLSYAYRDVDFLNAENTGFVPYITETGTGALNYDLTAKDKLTLSLMTVDYSSRDELITYQLFMSRVGIDHEFSETLSVNFTAGVSRQNTTSRQSQSFDFFGQPINITQETDNSNRSLLLDAGIKKLLNTGKIVGSISRDNRANSFGGLDQVDRFNVAYTDKISSLWRYNISGRFDDINSVRSGSTRTDRRLLLFDSKAYYAINKDWDFDVSYRYIQRRFSGSNSDSRAPSSNRVSIGLTYNFPSLSTF